MKSLKEIGDHFGIEKMPGIAGTKEGPLVVLGTARGVWDDLQNVPIKDYDTLAIKEIGWFYVDVTGKPLNHSASYEEFYNIGNRVVPQPGGNVTVAAKTVHIPASMPTVKGTIQWDVTKRCGTSGLFGVMVGVLMGYNPVILCGSPVDGSNHFYDPEWRKYPYYLRTGQTGEWVEACKLFKGRAVSMSGRTKEWLGTL